MIEFPAARRRHVLYGDGTGGGHMHGYGDPTKSHFPSRWNEARIVAAVLDLANDRNAYRVVQWNGRIRVEGVRDGVEIRVVLTADETVVWTAHPLRDYD